MKLSYNEEYQGCFVCGKENPQGLRLDFFHDEDQNETYARFTFPASMQGFANIVHGGFITMLLDEVMAKACLERCIPAVTAKIEVRYKKPVLVGEEVEVRGKVLEVRGKKVITRARCIGSAGEVKALCDGLFLKGD